MVDHDAFGQAHIDALQVEDIEHVGDRAAREHRQNPEIVVLAIVEHLEDVFDKIRVYAGCARGQNRDGILVRLLLVLLISLRSRCLSDLLLGECWRMGGKDKDYHGCQASDEHGFDPPTHAMSIRNSPRAGRKYCPGECR